MSRCTVCSAKSGEGNMARKVPLSSKKQPRKKQQKKKPPRQENEIHESLPDELIDEQDMDEVSDLDMTIAYIQACARKTKSHELAALMSMLMQERKKLRKKQTGKDLFFTIKEDHLQTKTKLKEELNGRDVGMEETCFNSNSKAIRDNEMERLHAVFIETVNKLNAETEIERRARKIFEDEALKMTDENKRLQYEHDKLTDQNNILQQSLDLKHIENNKLKHKVDKLNMEIKSQRKKENHIDKSHIAITHRSEQEEKLRRITTVLSERTRQKTKLFDEVCKLKLENKNIETHVKSLSEQRSSLHSTVADRDKKIKHLTASLNQNEQNILSLNTKLKQKEEELNITNNNLQQATLNLVKCKNELQLLTSETNHDFHTRTEKTNTDEVIARIKMNEEDLKCLREKNNRENVSHLQKIRELGNEIQSKNRTIEELENRLQTTLHDLQTVHSNVDIEERRRNKVEQELNNLSKVCSQLMNEKEQLKSEVEKNSRGSEFRSQEHRKLETNIQLLKNTIKDLECKLSDASRKLEEFQSKTVTEIQKRQEAESQVIDLSKSCNRLKNKIEKLQSKVVVQEGENKSQLQIITNLEGEIIKKNDEHEGLELQLSKTSKELKALQSNYRAEGHHKQELVKRLHETDVRFKNENEQLNAKLEKEEKEKEAQLQRIKDLMEELRLKNRTIKELEHRLSEKSNTLKAMQINDETDRQRGLDLEHELNDVSEICMQLKNENSQLHNKVEASQRENELQCQRIKCLEDEVKLRNDTIEDRDKQLNDALNELKTMQSNKEIEKHQMHESENKLSSISEDYLQLKNENRHLKSMADKLHTLESIYEQQSKDMETIKEVNGTYKREIEDMERTLDGFSKIKDRFDIALLDLKEKEYTIGEQERQKQEILNQLEHEKETSKTCVGTLQTELNRKIKQLEHEVQKKECKIKELDKIVENQTGMNRENHLLQERLTKAEKQVSIEQADKIQMMQNNDRLKADLSNAILQKQQSERSISEDYLQVKNENRHLKSMADKLHTLESIYEQQSKEMETIKEVNGTYKREIEDMERTLDGFSKIKDRFDIALQDIKEKEYTIDEQERQKQEILNQLEHEKETSKTCVGTLQTELNRKIKQLEHEVQKKECKIKELDKIVENQTGMNRENHLLQERLTKAEKQVSIEQEDKIQMMQNNDRLKADLSNAILQKQQSERQYIEEQQLQRHCETELSDLKKKISSLSALVQERDESIDNIKSLKDDAISQIKQELRKEQARVNIMQKEMVKKENQHDESIYNANKEIKDLKESLRKIKTENIQLHTDIKEAMSQISNLQIENARVVATLNNVKAELDKEKSKSYPTATDEISKLSRQLDGALAKLRDTENELDETKTRLSKVMGDRLTDNNPNIADLSDTNRPIKLSERFAELYDNQWTDAFDALEHRFATEQDVINALLKLLQDIMRFCSENARKQLDDVQNILILSSSAGAQTIPVDIRKQLKDCRKKMASVVVKNIYQVYFAHLQRTDPQTVVIVTDASPFVKESLEICWLMSIQDPPVVFAAVPQIGSVFNTDLFKYYTSSGKHVEYTVWPALLLHEGGPTLAKGVAQGVGKKKK